MDRTDKGLLANIFAIFLLAIFIITFALASLGGFGSARSSSLPQWDNIAGYANHACYRHGLVANIVATGSGGSDVDRTVICKDGWAFDLNDLGFDN